MRVRRSRNSSGCVRLAEGLILRSRGACGSPTSSNGMGGVVAETWPDLCSAQRPEGTKLVSATGMKQARCGGAKGSSDPAH